MQLKPIYLLVYFVLAFFYLETLFRWLITEDYFSRGEIIPFVFSVSIGLTSFIICTLFHRKTNYIIATIILTLFGFIFSSQLIYYKSFKTFYSLYSVGSTSQIFEFWKDITALIVENTIWIVLFFIPAFLLMALGKKVFSYKKGKMLYLGLLVCLIFVPYVLSIAIMYSNGKEQHSAYDLYFKSNYPLLSAQRLGLLTTMRLDLQRLMLGWSPIIEAPTQARSTYIPEISDIILEQKLRERTRLHITEKVEYNILEIDFSQLMSEENDIAIKEMHQYFNNVKPSKKNDYTGKYKGYNLVLITAEGFSPYAVREDVTPTLYKLVHEGYNFTNFYTPLWEVSTSDGEYVALTSLIPKSGVWSFKESSSIYLPFVMGNQLKKLDYKTVAYHNHTYSYYRRDLSHPNMGYDYKGIGNGLNVKKTWPASDLEMFENTIPEYLTGKPFHAYYMTVSGHMQYSFTGNNMAFKNKQYVKMLPYSDQGKAYIATQIELDRALQHLLEQIEKAGIGDKTLIAISADHYPYGLDEKVIDELAGKSVERNFQLYKSPFILYTKGMEPKTINKPGSSLDIIPTLSNLLGIEFDSRLLMGQDLFSDSEPLVIFHNKSFITDKGSYNAVTKEFVPFPGEKVDMNYINWISNTVRNKFYYSAKILEHDYYKMVFRNSF